MQFVLAKRGIRRGSQCDARTPMFRSFCLRGSFDPDRHLYFFICNYALLKTKVITVSIDDFISVLVLLGFIIRLLAGVARAFGALVFSIPP